MIHINQGQVWFSEQVQLWGFNTTFQFMLHGGDGTANIVTVEILINGFIIGEGFAFVIQNDDQYATGDIGPGLGYGDQGIGTAGIHSSLAIEFDTVQQIDLGDPNNNHISVHSRGAQSNSANETYSLVRQDLL